MLLARGFCLTLRWREQGSGTTFAMVATELAEASQVVKIISGEIERS
jgi:hypothetical protein